MIKLKIPTGPDGANFGGFLIKERWRLAGVFRKTCVL